MARFGHRDWLHWKDRTGAYHGEPATANSLKRCLLDVGTKGYWTLVNANDGIPMKGFWWLGINVLAQMRRGMR